MKFQQDNDKVHLLYFGDEKNEINTRSMTTSTRLRCDCKCLLRSIISFFPIFTWLPFYKRKYIVNDVLAGLALGLMQIPHGKSLLRS